MKRTALLPVFLVILFATTVFSSPRTHPYLFFQADDIPSLQEKIKSDPIASDAFAEIKTRVDDNHQLYLPELTDQIRTTYWRALSHNATTARNAAFIYLMTGDKQYLDIAVAFLILYADNFDTRVNFHLLEDKSYMRSYLTGSFAGTTAWAYDMVYNQLTDDQRNLIEQKLLRGIIQMVKDSRPPNQSDGNAYAAPDYEWGPGQWNGVYYCNAGIAAIGFAINDPEIYEHAVDNFKTYLARDMLTDGFLQEEDTGYSAFCYASLNLVAEMAHQFNYPENLYTIKVPSKPYDQWDPDYGYTFPSQGTDPGYRTMRQYLDALIDYQYPNLTPGNWGWQMNRTGFTHNNYYVTFLELAARRYPDANYDYFLAQMNRSRGAYTIWRELSPILYHQPIPENATPPATRSRWYDHGSWIALKSIEGPEYWNSDSLYAFMPYGLYRTKALQRMSVDLFAFGKVIAPRVAKTTRHQSHDAAFYLNDDAWNTIMLDGQNIGSFRRGTITESNLLFKDFNEQIKIAEAEILFEQEITPSIWSDVRVERRPDLDYRVSRTLALTDTYLLDITNLTFEQSQKYKHQLHWVWHAFGDITWQDTEHDNLTKEQWSATWLDPADNIGLRTTLLGSYNDHAPESSVLTKTLEKSTPNINYITAMRSNYEDAFIAIHEPFKGEPALTRITRIYEDDRRVAVKIESPTFTDYIAVAFNAENLDTTPSPAGGGPGRGNALAYKSDDTLISTTGRYAYVRVTGNTLTATGQLKSITLPHTNITSATLNGKPLNIETQNGATLITAP